MVGARLRAIPARPAFGPAIACKQAPTKIMVTDLVSAKSGKAYSAKIILDEASSKTKLDFGVPPSAPKL